MRTFFPVERHADTYRMIIGLHGSVTRHVSLDDFQLSGPERLPQAEYRLCHRTIGIGDIGAELPQRLVTLLGNERLLSLDDATRLSSLIEWCALLFRLPRGEVHRAERKQMTIL